MKTISVIQHRAIRSSRWALLFGPVGMEEYFFVCWTDEGSARQDEVLHGPAACGYSIADITAIPERNGVAKGLWKATVVGCDLFRIEEVHRRLQEQGWVLEAGSVNYSSAVTRPVTTTLIGEMAELSQAGGRGAIRYGRREGGTGPPKLIKISIGYSVAAVTFALLFLLNEAAHGLLWSPVDRLQNVICLTAAGLYTANIPLLVRRIRWGYWYNIILLAGFAALCLAEIVVLQMGKPTVAGRILLTVIFGAPAYHISATTVSLTLSKAVRQYYRQKEGGHAPP